MTCERVAKNHNEVKRVQKDLNEFLASLGNFKAVSFQQFGSLDEFQVCKNRNKSSQNREQPEYDYKHKRVITSLQTSLEKPWQVFNEFQRALMNREVMLTSLAAF